MLNIDWSRVFIRTLYQKNEIRMKNIILCFTSYFSSSSFFDMIHLDWGGFDVIYLNKDVLIYAIQSSVDRTSAFIERCSGLYSRV